jgi:hypothetical protein
VLCNFGRESIYEIDCSLKSRVPKSERYRGNSKKGETSFNNMSMISFNRLHLMMCMWTTKEIGHSMAVREV